MPMSTIAICICIFGIALLAVLFIVQVLNFNKTGAKKYCFTNFFPYELNSFRLYQKSSWIFPILSAVGLLAIIFPFILFAIVSKTAVSLSITIILAVLAFISAASFYVLTFIKLSNFKAHLAFDVIFVISTIVLNILMVLFFGSNHFLEFGINKSISIAITVIGIIIFVYLFALMLNPSFKHWAKLVKYDSDNYVRPKFSYLCMLEWGTFLGLILSLIPLFLAMFF